MKRAINKVKINNKNLIGIKIVVDELLILIFSFVQFNPIWNRVHKSWLYYSKNYISNLLSKSNLDAFPNLEILQVKCFKQNEKLELHRHKKIKTILLTSAKKNKNLYSNIYIAVNLSNLPRLNSIQIQSVNLNLLRVNQCSNLNHLSLKNLQLSHFLLDEISLLAITHLKTYKIYYKNTLNFTKNLVFLESDEPRFIYAPNCKILKTEELSGIGQVEELHTSDSFLGLYFAHIKGEYVKKLIITKTESIKQKIYDFNFVKFVFPNITHLSLIGFQSGEFKNIPEFLG